MTRRSRALPPDYERLTQALDYDPETGIFRWKTKPPRTRIEVGAVAGCAFKPTKNKSYYIQITLDMKPYQAHRLAWFYVYKVWPTLDIDHKDGDGCNNAILNLREADRSQNVASASMYSSNTSGQTGVRYYKKGDWEKWDAFINWRKQYIYLGSFDSFDAAVEARLTAEKKYFGEFAPSPERRAFA